MKKVTIFALTLAGLAAGGTGLALTVAGNNALTPGGLSQLLARAETSGGDGGHDGHGHDAPGSKTIAAGSDDEAGESHAGHDHADEHGPAHEGHDHSGDAGEDHKGHEDHDHADEDGQGHEGHDHSGDTGDSHDGHEGHDHPDEAERGHEGHDHSGDAGEDHDHGDHGDHGAVDLTQEQMDDFAVRTATVSGGPIAVTIERPAEVIYDQNALAHVVPRVAGIARSIDAAEGDQVAEGQTLAVLESRELADAKAAYLASLERLGLAKENFARADALIDKRIVSEKTHLEARTDFAEARINLRNARQKLFALGIDEGRLNEISDESESDLTEYVMHAPIGGTVVTRHLTRGESVPTDREAFVIADVSTVWVDVSIYAHDLERVQAGQAVTITTDGGVEVDGVVAFVTPNVLEETRTANARVVLENDSMRLRPGMFVTARIAIVEAPAEVRVPATALQTHEGKDVVFVKEAAGQLKPQPVTLGRRNSHYVEVLAGLRTGETVVTDGAFVVKSQLAKSGFDDGHNH